MAFARTPWFVELFLGLDFMQSLKFQVERTPEGPREAARRAGRAVLVGQARNTEGQTVRSRLPTALFVTLVRTGRSSSAARACSASGLAASGRFRASSRRLRRSRGTRSSTIVGGNFATRALLDDECLNRRHSSPECSTSSFCSRFRTRGLPRRATAQPFEHDRPLFRSLRSSPNSLSRVHLSLPAPRSARCWRASAERWTYGRAQRRTAARSSHRVSHRRSSANDVRGELAGRALLRAWPKLAATLFLH